MASQKGHRSSEIDGKTNATKRPSKPSILNGTREVTQPLNRLQFGRHQCNCAYETITFKYTHNLQLYIYSTFPNINIVFVFFFFYSNTRTKIAPKTEKWAAHVAQIIISIIIIILYITKRPSGCAFAINCGLWLALPCAPTIFHAPFQFCSQIDNDLHGFSIFILPLFSYLPRTQSPPSSVCSINHSWKK